MDDKGLQNMIIWSIFLTFITFLQQVSGFNIDISIIYEWNKTSETSNMELPSYNSFCLITSHNGVFCDSSK